jgi:uncharacterized protein YkwD
MRSAKELDRIRKEVERETNKIRTNPKSYIPILEQYLQWFDGNVLDKPDSEAGIETQEGPSAYKEAIQFLKTQKPIDALIYDTEVAKASEEYAIEIGRLGTTDHDFEETSIEERISKYVDWDIAISENVDFGGTSGEEIVINLLVDDGVDDRSHRANLFNTKTKYFGIGVSTHKEYELCTVIDYIGDIICYANKSIETLSKNSSRISYGNLTPMKGNLKVGNKALDSMMMREQIKNRNKNNVTQEEVVEYNGGDEENPFIDDVDAPENCIRRRLKTFTKRFGRKLLTTTVKTYTLDDGSEEIVTIDEVS